MLRGMVTTIFSKKKERNNSRYMKREFPLTPM